MIDQLKNDNWHLFLRKPNHCQYLLLRLRYLTASEMCISSIISLPAKSAIVRATFIILSYALAEGDSESNAECINFSAWLESRQYFSFSPALMLALQVQPLPEKRSICIFRAAVTRFLMLSELSPPLYWLSSSYLIAGTSICMSSLSRSGPDMCPK